MRLLSKLLCAGAAVVALAALPAGAAAAPIYADAAVGTNVTSFGSGILTDAPDGGGAFLSNTFDPPTLMGEITATFSGGLADGAGADIVIHDCCGGSAPLANEFADVFVSNDGVAFTYLGAYGAGAGVNSFDLAGVFAQTVFYVRIVNTSTENSPDIDAFQGNYAAVPEPATLFLLGMGMALAARRQR